MNVISKVKHLFLENILKLVYYIYNMDMKEDYENVGDMINDFIKNPKFETLSEAEKNELRTNLEISYMDIYHNEVLKNLDPILQEEFLTLSKDFSNQNTDSFLISHIEDYYDMMDRIYIKFLQSLLLKIESNT
ncbi:hypothetical protein EBU94_01170 [bacterium]|nr:hypothetical protein [bacterium]NBO36262.1 hypothetical protein [bacterium]